MRQLLLSFVLIGFIAQLNAQTTNQAIAQNFVAEHFFNVSSAQIPKIEISDYSIGQFAEKQRFLLYDDSVKIVCPNISNGQKWLKASIVPASFITAGIITMAVPKSSFISRYTIQEKVHDAFPDAHVSFDNYFQFVPGVAVFALNIAGVKSRNDLLNQALITAKAELLMNIIVHSMKKGIHVKRPDHSSDNSMPSGHTAQAFLSATILDMEYRDTSPWISVGGYAVATATAFGRMVNNKHWVSDVLVGAGIGIFSAKVVYLTHQNRWGRKSNAMIVPMVYPEGAGVAFSMQF